MPRYLVEYEYELAGWDEFGYSKICHCTVEANSEEEAMEIATSKTQRGIERRWALSARLLENK
jgi:hypothetical protein